MFECDAIEPFSHLAGCAWGRERFVNATTLEVSQDHLSLDQNQAKAGWLIMQEVRPLPSSF